MSEVRGGAGEKERQVILCAKTDKRLHPSFGIAAYMFGKENGEWNERGV